MATMREVWGFGHITTISPDDGSEPLTSRFCKAINAAAKDRNIPAHIPSDALDLSRDLMIDEAAHSLGMQWEIVDDTMRLWPIGVTIDWSKITA